MRTRTHSLPPLPWRLPPVALVIGLAILFLPIGQGSAARTPFPNGSIDFEATDLNGEPYRAAQKLRGKVVLLDFWATWCSPCVKAIPRLNELRQEFEAGGFEVLGLASYSGTLADVRIFLEKRDAQFPIVMVDADIIEQFKVVGFPTYFLVDRQGHIAEIYVGEIESQLDKVRTRIRGLLPQ